MKILDSTLFLLLLLATIICQGLTFSRNFFRSRIKLRNVLQKKSDNDYSNQYYYIGKLPKYLVPLLELFGVSPALGIETDFFSLLPIWQSHYLKYGY